MSVFEVSSVRLNFSVHGSDTFSHAQYKHQHRAMVKMALSMVRMTIYRATSSLRLRGPWSKWFRPWSKCQPRTFQRMVLRHKGRQWGGVGQVLVLAAALVVVRGVSSTRASTSGFCQDSTMATRGMSFPGRCGVGINTGLFQPGRVGPNRGHPTVVINRPVKTIGRRTTGLCTVGVTRHKFIALTVSLSF